MPLLPKSLRSTWSDEELPGWAVADLGLAPHATFAALDSDVWSSVKTLSERVRSFLVWVVHSRDESILDLIVIDAPWPVALDPVSVPWRARTWNCIEKSGLLNRFRNLPQIRYRDLFSVRAMGALSILDFACTLERAIGVYSGCSVVGAVSGPRQPELPLASEELIRALDESWVDKVSEQDPRFAALLPPGKGTLFERIDVLTSVPSDSPAQVQEHSLATAIGRVTEAVERLESKPLEDLLKDYIGRVANLQGERLQAILARFGALGAEPATLQTAANMIGLTRERLRQLELRVLKRLPTHPVVMPSLDRAIELLEKSAPIDADSYARLVMQHGLSKGPFHPRSILQAARLTGRTVNIKAANAPGRERFIGVRATEPSPRIISVAYRQAGASGVSNVLELSAELHDIGLPESPERVREILRSYSDVQFLDDDWFWYPGALGERNRLRNVSRKVLSVASAVDVAVMREGVRRFFKYRRRRGLSKWPLLVAPRSVLEAFYRADPDFTMDAGLVAHVAALDYRAELSPSEQVMVAVLRSSPTGLLDRASFERGCLDHGVTRETFRVFTSYSPVIEHVGTGLWTVRGLKVDPLAVEALRRANAERPHERRILNHGWTPCGKLWIGVRLSAAMSVVGIPAALRHTLSNRAFPAKDDAGAPCGTIRIDPDGVSWGYGPYLRRVGADEGDILLISFDLIGGVVTLEVGDDEHLDQLDPQ